MTYYDDEKFLGIYRIGSARLKGFDYGSNHAYFVTICTKGMRPYFGKIENGIMGLSNLGCKVWQCWYEIPIHFPFVELDEFVVMPNHVHGIIYINKSDPQKNVETQNLAPVYKNVETQNLASVRNENQASSQISNQFGPQSKNLASIIRGFKIGVTKFARENDTDFAWQPRFHDHIIRNEFDLNRIRQYIHNNPKNWKKDKFQI